jgi:acyl-CoA synthetase (AMP-forming)/AMP-acid ligase II
MLDTASFSQELEERLISQRDRILLRIAIGGRERRVREFTGSDLVVRSRSLAAQHCPEGRRQVVLLLLPHSPELFLLHLGLVLNGHIPAILAWPTSRIDPDKYQRNLLHQLRNLPADLLITLPRLAGNLGPSLPFPVASCLVEECERYEQLFPTDPISEALAAAVTPAADNRPPADAVFLQFSGGTTGAQKAVVVTDAMMAAQMDLLREALGVAIDDHVVSWLPMYHDMGLIACLWFPLWHGIPSLHMAAGDWVVQPELLPEYISEFRGTLCWLPNFAFSYMAQRRGGGAYRLDQVRAWINCSEPVRRRSMLMFADAFRDCGVADGALQASYAMAESVFAVTQTSLGLAPPCVPRNGFRTNALDYPELAYDLVDDVFVSSGTALRDTEIRIQDPSGRQCADGVAGEILIRTPSLFGGYWGTDGFHRTSLSNGWHATGDYGFLTGGHLYVIGRLKDIVIIGGQNVFPEDVELVVNSIPGVYPGRVVAFGVEDEAYGTQALAITAEMAGAFTSEGAEELSAAIRKTVLATIGIAPRYVHAVPQRWIVKSTAGKISRRETRERFIRERLLARSEATC